MKPKNEAEKQNPALEKFAVFIGEWKTTGTHPLNPGKIFHGKTTFEWLNNGAFLRSYSEIDEPEIPSGISIIGSDDVTGKYFMIYFDERTISRKYDITFKKDIMTSSRTTPEFSQRMVLTISNDGKTIISKGEMSKDGGAWEGDLELEYTKIF